MPAVVTTARDIFLSALDQANPSERAAFINQACAGDLVLQRHVEALFRNHEKADSLLDQPRISLQAGDPNLGSPPVTLDQSLREQPGTLIGPYKLLEQVGEGGMGVVYVAEQTEPVRRRVALKIIKPGMDTKQVIARFEAERQALAMMDHPNIAKILDAGTTGGQNVEGGKMKAEPAVDRSSVGPHPSSLSCVRPYFVMELVRGMPITQYCDKVRLSPRQRLELFVDVCHAIQHAHQKGIIHRDLKPSNILITLHDGKPVVKVIDFGVAKAIGQQLTERTVYTALTQLVGTPLYMSPEQAELSGLDIDTRSDVYSLGVLLYELLTGQTPFDKERLQSVSFDEMRRMIREDEPPRPSRRFSTLAAAAISTASQHRGVDERRLSRILSGELDWIVMKALEKDRSRRYESASALAADIQRYLSDEPVLACPPTTMYRFQKFARKHRPALFTAASIAFCLLLGTTVSAWQAVRATQAETEANANAIEAQEKAKEATEQRDEVKALADKLAAKDEELQQTLYADHIYMAKEAWEAGNVDRVKSLLDRHNAVPGEPDRRGFEWHYLNRLLSAGPLLSLGAATHRPNQFTLNQDRTRLILLNPNGPRDTRTGRPLATGPELQVWNLQTGQQELTAAVPGATFTRGYRQPKLIFSPDIRWMANSSSRFDLKTKTYVAGDVKVWDTKDGKQILSIGGVIGGGVFSPDSKLLATTMEDQSVKLWELPAGQERTTLKGQLELPHRVAFSPDGNRLAVAGNKWDQAIKAGVAGEIKICDVQSGELVQTLKGHKEWMTSLVFSPDGRLLATEADDFAIKLWDTHSGEELRTFSTNSTTDEELQFNATGDRLIGSIKDKMWNVHTGQKMLSIEDGELQFSPDGQLVALTDWANHRTKVFDAQSGKIMLSIKDADGEVAFSSDSKHLATESGGIRIWNLETGDEINHIKGFDGEGFLAFSHDGQRLIGGNWSSVQVWDAKTEQRSGKKLTLTGIGYSGLSRGGGAAVISSDFTRIAGISWKTIKLFDVNTGQVQRMLTGHDQSVLCVAISHDGKRIASSDGIPNSHTPAGTVKVWNAETGKEMFTINGLSHSIIRLKFSPDGKKLAGTPADRTIKVWDANLGSELYSLGTRPSRFGNSSWDIHHMFAFSPDGKRLAWQGKIWDAATGDELVRLMTDKTGCDTTAFSPDGKRVIGGIASQKANGVWDSETGKLLFTIPHSSDDGCQTFSPDGKRVTSGHKIWDAQTGKELMSLGDNDGGQVAFSPDGHRLAVFKGRDNEVTIYDATPLPEKP